MGYAQNAVDLAAGYVLWDAIGMLVQTISIVGGYYRSPSNLGF
jgi:hypothetical protein